MSPQQQKRYYKILAQTKLEEEARKLQKPSKEKQLRLFQSDRY